MKKLLIALFLIASTINVQAMKTEKTEVEQRLERLEKVKQARQAQQEPAIVGSFDLTQDHMRLDVLERVKAALEKADQDSKLEKVLAALQQAGTREE